MLICPREDAAPVHVKMIPSRAVSGRGKAVRSWQCANGHTPNLGQQPICGLDGLVADHPVPEGKRDGYWCANLHLNGQDVGLTQA